MLPQIHDIDHFLFQRKVEIKKSGHLADLDTLMYSPQSNIHLIHKWVTGKPMKYFFDVQITISLIAEHLSCIGYYAYKCKLKFAVTYNLLFA